MVKDSGSSANREGVKRKGQEVKSSLRRKRSLSERARAAEYKADSTPVSAAAQEFRSATSPMTGSFHISPCPAFTIAMM